MKGYINPEAKASDFNNGELVRYVPLHATSRYDLKACEDGVVNSVNEKFVFVKYLSNGIFDHSAIATDPRDLIKSKDL